MASATHQPSGPALQRLRYELQNQRRHAGDPSYRDIALRTSKALSHTTVGSVLRCESVPNWGQLELVVDVLGGDVETFRVLWRAARDETSPLALPAPSPEWFPEETVRTPAAELTLSDLDEAEADLRERDTDRRRREADTRRELVAALDERADLGDRLGALRERLGRERGRTEELERQIADLRNACERHARKIKRLKDELRVLREERITLLERLEVLSIRRGELNFTWAREVEAQLRSAEDLHRTKDARLAALDERLLAAEALLTEMAKRAERARPEA
ncbi:MULTISPECIES: hypothetical protein [Streptomyces]|nr:MULTISPECIES: hypothetical protein [Streptomyces]